MMLGALVLAEGIVGMTEASAMRNPLTQVDIAARSAEGVRRVEVELPKVTGAVGAAPAADPLPSRLGERAGEEGAEDTLRTDDENAPARRGVRRPRTHPAPNGHWRDDSTYATNDGQLLAFPCRGSSRLSTNPRGSGTHERRGSASPWRPTCTARNAA